MHQWRSTLQAQSNLVSRSRSGTPSVCGHGTFRLKTVPSAETTLWIFASNARPTRALLLRKNAPSLGVNATMLSTSTAFHDGSRHVRYARSTTEIGNCRSTVVELLVGCFETATAFVH